MVLGAVLPENLERGPERAGAGGARFPLGRCGAIFKINTLELHPELTGEVLKRENALAGLLKRPEMNLSRRGMKGSQSEEF